MTRKPEVDELAWRRAVRRKMGGAEEVIRSQLGPTAPPYRPSRVAPRRRAKVFALSAALAVAGTAWAQQPDQPGGARVVRAYFDDPLIAARAVISLDALESEYEKGYIVLLATDEDIEAARQAGMRVVDDHDYVSVVLPSELPTEVVQGTIAGFPCYRTVEETYASARAIVSQHPALATWTTVGKSWKKAQSVSNGYDLNVLRLTNSATSGTKPALFITAAVHAREYTTAELALRFAEYLVDSYETDADVRWLLDYQEVHIMLHANPDGRKRAEEGVLWRKNHNTNHCPGIWPGIDLNRNFDFKWGEAGTTIDECSLNYPGLSAASEPETKAIQTYMANLFPDARGPNDNNAASADTSGVLLDIHSHGRLILWPWGHVDVPAPNGTALQTLGRKLAYFNGYTPLRAYGLYPTSGTTEDYGYGVLGRASFTYELGTTFFQDCSDFENSIQDDNIASLLYAFKVARTPYLTPAGPDARNLSLSGGASTTGVTAGTAVALSATFDDTRYENSNGAEPTRAIAAGEYYLDVPHWATGAVPDAMSASDGAFGSSSEAATATIETTGLSTGRHTVFVRAKDSDDNWGAVTAVFLVIDTPTPPPPPPEAAFDLSFECTDGPCRVLTGIPVTFTDTSSSTVRFRTWDFGDGTTSGRASLEHAWTSPGFYRVTLTVGDGSTESSASRVFLVEASEPAGTCAPDEETLCLRDSRYQVRVEWWSEDGERTPAQVVHEGTNDSGLFQFFDQDNWELLIKVLDGCSVNGSIWVFAASATDRGYSITVTDTKTESDKEYRNNPGRRAPAITDVVAFPAGCDDGNAVR